MRSLKRETIQGMPKLATKRGKEKTSNKRTSHIHKTSKFKHCTTEPTKDNQRKLAATKKTKGAPRKI